MSISPEIILGKVKFHAYLKLTVFISTETCATVPEHYEIIASKVSPQLV